MARYSYYYRSIEKVLKFLIPSQKNILYYGAHNLSALNALQPTKAICIDVTAKTKNDFSNIQLVTSDYHNYSPAEKFDYVVLDVAIGQTEDICRLLENLHSACERHTRIIIHQENYLWQWIFRLASAIGLKNKEATQNWLSIGDVKSYLHASGFEVTRVFRKTVFPLQLIFIGPLLNYFFSIIPLLDFFKLDQYIIARKKISRNISDAESSLTICLTVRDEEENIEHIVKSLPQLTERQEILFVEGHSKDKTVSEIQRMQKDFPQKNIHLLHQKGKGQGDAIRIGFKNAEGDIIILYEGDGTSNPDDIKYFYEAMKNNHYEFIEGSRFVYPLENKSMPFFNKVGNIFFSKWFSMFLNQRITDTLSGIKAIFKKEFQMIDSSWGFLGINDPFGDFELLFGAAKYGLKIGEIPIRYKPRTYGISKTNVWRHGSYLFRMALNGYFIFRQSKKIK